MKHHIAFLLLVVFGFVSAEPTEKLKTANRIIALSPHSVELLYAIGAGDRIIATVEYADYPESAKSIPRIGSYTGVQLEKVLTLEPDLIVAWRTGNKSSDLEKMESLGLNLVYTEPQSVNQMLDDILELGEHTGLQSNAKKLVNDLKQRYQNIKQNAAKGNPVKVFYQMWHDPIRTLGLKASVATLIRDCNGVNVFDDASTDYPLVSLESVIVKDPQVIIIPHKTGNLDERKSIWKNWQEIAAVKNHHLYTVNGDFLHRFTPRTLDGLNTLCEAIGKARQ